MKSQWGIILTIMVSICLQRQVSAGTAFVDELDLTGTIVVDVFEDGVLNSEIGTKAADYSMSETNGVLMGTVPENIDDPKFILGYNALDAMQYPYFRIGGRQSSSTRGDTAVFYYNTIGEGIDASQKFNFLQVASNGYFEGRGQFDTNLITQIDRFRLDPLASTVSYDVTFEYHYIYLDKVPTFGIAEFEAEDDLSDLILHDMSMVSVDAGGDGVAKLTATTSDPYIYTGSAGIDADAYNAIEIRCKVANDSSLGDALVFWGASGFSGERQYSFSTVKDGQFHTYLIYFSDESSWTGTINSFRLDPFNKNEGTIEIDYIRAVQAPPVPTVYFMLGRSVSSRKNHQI